MAADLFLRGKPAAAGTELQYDRSRARLITVVMLLMMGYFAIGVRLVDLSILGHQNDVVMTDKEDAAPLERGLRGSIVDRNGILMAASLKMASLYADASMVEAPEELAQKLSRILPEQSYKDLLQKLGSGKHFVWIQRDVSPKQEYVINALGDPALGFQEEDRRIYPQANLTAHITGYTDLDGKGIAGIEKFFDRQLTETNTPVRLTIDLRVQHMMHRELGKAMSKFHAKGAIGMVLDVNSGELISMVSLPDFDPNHAGEAGDQQKFNRATLGVFEMGSTFKLFSTAAALNSG
ncbi:MAG: penicillin-binding protein 2, partial [Proteobacteria bacterium]|nr:penicillin-binding protein 2 [Pseudomonadota bacterium]